MLNNFRHHSIVYRIIYRFLKFNFFILANNKKFFNILMKIKSRQKKERKREEERKKREKNLFNELCGLSPDNLLSRDCLCI